MRIVPNHRHTVLRLVLSCVCVSTLGVCPQSQAQGTPRERSLTESVATFLTYWLCKHEPTLAVRYYLSPQIKDESLVPAEWYSAADYHGKFPADRRQWRERPIKSEVIADAITKYLGAAVRNADWPRTERVQEVLGPFGSETDPKLWTFISSEERQPVKLGELPVVAYRVSRWEDFSWTASGTIGHRRLLPGLIKTSGLDMRGAVCRIRRPGSDHSALTFMLWADESPNKSGTWKFWGIVPVASQ